MPATEHTLYMQSRPTYSMDNLQVADVEAANLIGATTPTFLYQSHILGLQRTLFAVMAEPIPIDEKTALEQQRRVERLFFLLVAAIPDKQIRKNIMDEFVNERVKLGSINAAMIVCGNITDYLCAGFEFVENTRVVGL